MLPDTPPPACEAATARSRFRVLGVREVASGHAGVRLLDAAWGELTDPSRTVAPASIDDARDGTGVDQGAPHYLALWVDDIDNAAAWVAGFCPTFVVGRIRRTVDGVLACPLERVTQSANHGAGGRLDVELVQSCMSIAVDTPAAQSI